MPCNENKAVLFSSHGADLPPLPGQDICPYEQDDPRQMVWLDGYAACQARVLREMLEKFEATKGGDA